MGNANISKTVVADNTVNRFGTELSFDRKDVIGRGGFGVVFKGKFKNSIDVAIKRFEIVKVDINFEVSYMTTFEGHPNVLRCYCVEQDVNFW